MALHVCANCFHSAMHHASAGSTAHRGGCTAQAFTVNGNPVNCMCTGFRPLPEKTDEQIEDEFEEARDDVLALAKELRRG